MAFSAELALESIDVARTPSPDAALPLRLDPVVGALVWRMAGGAGHHPALISRESSLVEWVRELFREDLIDIAGLNVYHDAFAQPTRTRISADTMAGSANLDLWGREHWRTRLAVSIVARHARVGHE